MAAMYQLLDIDCRLTSPYHPQSNFTEWVNREVKVLIREFTETHKDWDSRLPQFGFALWSTPHSRTGFSPAEIVLGF